MQGREEEIGVARQRGWHGDCTLQVTLDGCQAPAQRWLPACLPARGESRSAAHSWQQVNGIPQAAARAPISLCSCQTQPLGSGKHIPGFSDLHQLEAWLWPVLSLSPVCAVRSEGGLSMIKRVCSPCRSA